MKLQHLIIIFLVIMLPVVLVLSQYTSLQIDTLAKKTQYDTALLGATFDTMAAFELNTLNSDSSSVVGEEIRDMEAIISTFTNSLSTSMDITGVDKNYILSYVPAMVFTLYDGYYIYSISGIGDSNERELKPYVYYTKTYINGSTNVTIAFSLDNYVSIYGTYEDGGIIKTISAAGYLVVPEHVEISDEFAYINTTKEDGSAMTKVIDARHTENNPDGKSWITYKNINIEPEIIYENEPYTEDLTQLALDKQEETTDSMMYYYEAKQFTEIYNKVVNALGASDKQSLYIDSDNDPEDETSPFMNEKVDVIKDSITSNLNAAIYNYEGRTGEECEMPQLNGEDWDKILNDISIIAFLKDIPIGTTKYNNYVVVNSTTNQKYVSAKSINFVGYKNYIEAGVEETRSLNYYHKITCSDLINDIETGTVDEVVGYASVDFERYKYSADEENQYYYYYKHNEYADYNCEVNSIQSIGVAGIDGYLGSVSNKDKILKTYYSAVGRVRYRLVKPSSYIKLTDTTRNFTVRYHTVDGSALATVSSDAGRIRVTQEGPSIIGKSFMGWSKDAPPDNVNADVKVGDTIYLENGEVLDLYAVYDEQYTITYYANVPEDEVVSVPAQATKLKERSYKISEFQPTRANYIFKGWAITEEGLEVYQPGDYYYGDEDLNLYAVWEEREVTIELYSNRGVLSNTQSDEQLNKRYNASIALEPSNENLLIRTGYTCMGWGTRPSGDLEYEIRRNLFR